MNGRGHTARIASWFERWGVTATVLVGALLLFVGLGRTGLWDPWEMDRAHLARTFVEPPQVMIALRGSEGTEDGAALRRRVEEAADAAGVAPRFARVERDGRAGSARDARRLRKALDRAGQELAVAVVLDLSLMGDGDDPPDWGTLWDRVREAGSNVPAGRIVLLSDDEGPGAEAIRHNLGVERLRAGWERFRRLLELDRRDLPDASDERWAEHVRRAGVLSRVRVVDPSDEEALRAGLDGAREASDWTVRFKEGGRVHAVPPLRYWLTAVSYGTVGISELGARLPGALLALLTLVLVVVAVRRHWGVRPAVLAGLVLLTTPQFFGQARHLVSSTGVTLGLSLAGVALLRLARDELDRWTWAALAGGTAIAFLAAGLYGLTIVTLMSVGFAAVVRGRRLVDWGPGAALAALLGVAMLWVWSEPPHAFAGQFRFTMPLFREGPTPYMSNFDYAIKNIGFGAFPWSILYPIAFGGLAWRAGRERDRESVALLLWFAVPTLATMGMLKDFNRFLWVAAPAAALGVTLLLEQLIRRGIPSAFIGLLVLLMAVIVGSQLADSPRPLADFLAWDPPFSDESGRRFPQDLSWQVAYRLPVLLLLLVPILHYTRVLSRSRGLLAFFRRERPCAFTLGGALALLPGLWLARAVSRFGAGMDRPGAQELTASQRGFVEGFLGSPDPMVLLAWATLALLAATLVVRFVAAPWLARLPEGLRLLAAAPLRAVGALPEHAARRIVIGAFVLLGVHMLLSVSWPAGYWAETLLDPAAAFVVALALAAFARAWARGVSGPEAAGWGLAVLGLFLGTRLARDASLHSVWAVGLTLVGWLAGMRLLLPRLNRDAATFAVRGGLVAAVAFGVLVVPIVDRYDRMLPLLYPESAETLTSYLLLESRTSLALYAVIVGLVLNRWLAGTRAPATVGRLVAGLERGPTAAGATVLAAAIFAVGLVGSFYPSFARRVSQKHILDTYREAEGLESQELGDRIFRHGRFSSDEEAASNFYVAGIPEIRQRREALALLQGHRDQRLSLETTRGAGFRLVPGWSDDNDPNDDGERDWAVTRGTATGVESGRLTDADASWEPDEHAGRVLVDPGGRTFRIAGNDATTLELESRTKPTFHADRPERNVYVIDDADAPVHEATAERRDRNYVLLPVESFSRLNHDFRGRTDGRHVPVLDARSNRVLLAASWLEDDEPQRNRYAEHTMSVEAFEELDRPRLHRGRANFGDRIRVRGYEVSEEVVSRGSEVKLRLYFEVIGDIQRSWKIFLHIDRPGTTNRIHGDHWPLNRDVAGDQDQCVGCYRTDHWMEGDVVVDVWEGEVPLGTPSGPQAIWMGFYRPGADRLPVESWQRERLRHDGRNRVRLGTFQVR